VRSVQHVLERPDIADAQIADRVHEAYGLTPGNIAFLPLGADQNTAVFRVTTRDGTAYFLKLRRGAFDETSVTLPEWFSTQGLAQVIAPLPTLHGALWGALDAFKLILYPFVEGRNAYEVPLSDVQWRTFGWAVQCIHSAVIPPSIAGSIPREGWSPQWRRQVASFVAGAAERTPVDPVAGEVLKLLHARRAVILDLVERTEQLATVLQTQVPAFVVCHSDLHAGNLHITGDGTLYIVDWDNPILAPKERDLMYAGAGLCGAGRTPQEEEALFYRGYGQTAIDTIALAYYRYERIVQDIAAYCEQLLLSGEGGEDRAWSLHYLVSNFLRDGTIEIARAAEMRHSVRRLT
jgi:spectinomycin phosphotransferase